MIVSKDNDSKIFLCYATLHVFSTNDRQDITCESVVDAQERIRVINLLFEWLQSEFEGIEDSITAAGEVLYIRTQLAGLYVEQDLTSLV